MNLSIRERALCLAVSLGTVASGAFAALPIEFDDTAIVAADVAAVLVAALVAIAVPLFAWRMVKRAIGR